MSRWKPVPGYEGYYSVSRDGEIYSARSQKILKPAVLSTGYFQVQLSVNGHRLQEKVHRLVALAFVGKPSSPRLQVAHNNGDPADNRAENLRWATPSENQRDRRAHGTASIGEANSRAKLKEADVREIRSSQARTSDLARQYGISHTQMTKIRQGLSWCHLD